MSLCNESLFFIVHELDVQRNLSILQIPTTRPISPKLGRNKNSASTTNSSESGGSGLSPRVAKEPDKSPRSLPSNGDKSTATSKKPVRNPQTDTLSQPAVTKTKEKSAATKSKTAKIKSPDQKTCAQKTEETETEPASHTEFEEQTGEKSENSPDDNIAHSHLTNPVVVPAQVAVEG